MSDSSFLPEMKEGLFLTIRVVPRSSRDEIVGTYGTALEGPPNRPAGRRQGRRSTDPLSQYLSGNPSVSPSCVCQVQQKEIREDGGSERHYRVLVSLLFPPNRGFGGSAPKLIGCLAALLKMIVGCSCRSQFQAVQLTLFLFG